MLHNLTSDNIFNKIGDVCRHSLVVKQLLPKQWSRVRFSLPAPKQKN